MRVTTIRRSLPEGGRDRSGIDDSVAVEAQGRAHGFRVLRLGPGDLEWVRRVMAGG